MKHSFIEKLYCLSVILAFGLLFYANAEAQEAPNGAVYNLGIGKAFYIPCGLALICSFFLKIKHDWLDKVLYGLIFVAILSTCFHPPLSGTFLTWTITRFVMAILCFKGVRDIDPLLLAKYATVLSPLIVFPHYILSDPFSYGNIRYGGFYGDPNFLALSLNFLIALCYITSREEKSILIKILSVSSIVGAVPLIILGASRGGIMGLSIVILFILIDTFKRSKRGFLFLVAVLVLAGGLLSRKMSDTLDLVERRYQAEAESDQAGARARIEGIEDAFRVLGRRPSLIPFGIGLGNTFDTIAQYREDGYRSFRVIHNTYIALLYESGLISLVLYLMIYVYAFKNLLRKRKYFLTGILLSAIVSLFTLPGVAFMPGWILLFFMSNKKIELITV